ncbi:MAG: hypothetical protein J0H82_06290 [Alphaproteobacteria bacterium]|jgi:hypothetical protein|nr:hypothetical protein [Alphaproteobacteria bacterium]
MGFADSVNCVVGFPRWTDRITWSGPGVASYPASNVSVYPLSQVWRSTGLGADALMVVGSFDRDRGVRLVGVCNHNLTLQAMMRVRLYERAPVAWTVNTTTDVITATGHALVNGNSCIVYTGYGGSDALPTSTPQIVRGTVYYVGSVSGSTFKLYTTQASALAGTGAIDFSTTGTGTHRIIGPILYDSDFIEVWPPVFPAAEYSGSPEWEENNWWDGKYTTEQLADTAWHRPVLLDRIYLARAMTVEFLDPDNPAGYVQAGVVEVAQGTQLSVNFSYGAELGFRFRSVEVEAFGGTKSFLRKNKPRRFTAQVENLPDGESLALIYELQRQLDVDVPFLWVENPAEPQQWLRKSFPVRNRLDSTGIRYTSYASNTILLSLEEVL